MVLTAEDLNPAAASDTSGFGPPFTNYDPAAASGSAVLQVTPVPEPSGLWACGLAAGVVPDRRAFPDAAAAVSGPGGRPDRRER